jgi:hypothetical protein
LAALHRRLTLFSPLPSGNARSCFCRSALQALPKMSCVLYLQGVPWYYKAGCDATLLYCMDRNTGFSKTAGDPAFAFLFLGGILHLISVLALYARWGGRSSWIPHTALVRP